MQSTKKISWGSSMGSDLDAVSTMRWTPWLSGFPHEGELDSGRRYRGIPVTSG
jgi:hypothetical protein